MNTKKNLKKLLNLTHLDYTNLTAKCGILDMPYLKCTEIPIIDYMANYSQPAQYSYSANTCVTFFEYDNTFDGINGLWNAIYYKIENRLKFYKKRFQGVKYFVAPDYSKCGDVPEIENLYRQYKSRIVSIWLTMNLHAIVIPLVSCANKTGMEYMLDGMEDCSAVAFNAKGALGNPSQLKIFIESIKYTVDHLQNLKTILVYSSSPNKNKILEIFDYAIKTNPQQ
jgi:hypothetical protein